MSEEGLFSASDVETGLTGRPVRELRAFTKVRLEPGEKRSVSLELSRRSFAYWDIDAHDWVDTLGPAG